MQVQAFKSGLLTLVLGLGLVFTQSAFKSANLQKKGFAPVTFYYHGPNFTKFEVEDESNWNTTSPGGSCLGNDKACSITVDEDYVDNPSTTPTLNPSINLEAENSPASLARVKRSDDGSMIIANNEQ